MRPRHIVMPGPRAHLAGTLRLLDLFAHRAGGEVPTWLRRFLDRPDALPAEVRVEQNSLKYDAYLASGTRGTAWGVATVERWEGAAMLPEVAALVEGAGGNYALPLALELRDALLPASPWTVLGVAFDRPGAPPRLKVYLQEDRWGRGLADRRTLDPLLARLVPGCEIPAWIPADRPFGVLTLDLLADGSVRPKGYLGGKDAAAAAAGAPSDVEALAAAMADACPWAPAWYYLTVRMAVAEPPRYAINKIYEHVPLGFGDGGVDLPLGWADVRTLFATAGQQAAFDALSTDLATLVGVRVVPTATALEDQARSADVYCAAWAMAAR